MNPVKNAFAKCIGAYDAEVYELVKEKVQISDKVKQRITNEVLGSYDI